MSNSFAELMTETMHRRGIANAWELSDLSKKVDPDGQGISHNTIYRIQRGESTPAPQTVRILALTLGINEQEALRAAGHLGETSNPHLDPMALQLAGELTALPLPLRDAAHKALGALIDSLSPYEEVFSQGATEKAPLLKGGSEEEVLREALAVLKKERPDLYRQFLAEQADEVQVQDHQ